MTLMASLLCGSGDKAAAAELLSPIMEASEKSFLDFVRAAIALKTPPLPLPPKPGNGLSAEAVSTLVWKRISSVDLLVTPENKAEKLELLQAMGSLRAWILAQNFYANLFYAAYIQDAVSMAMLSALSNGDITIAEAKQVLANLRPAVSSSAMLEVAQQCVPESAALKKISDRGAASITILTIAEKLEKELNEHLDMRVTNLIEQERPASLAFYVALSSSTTYLAALLVDLAAKEGDPNLLNGKVADSIKQMMPEVIGSVDPATGMKIEAAMFGGLMQNVRKWKTRH